MQSNNTPTTLLIILDGWGYREQTDHNAIAHANKPNWDQLLAQYPHTYIEGSGTCVGLPNGQMGNSEVGHLTIGAGRTVYQDLSRIDRAIETKEFFNNSTLLKAIKDAKANDKAIHILGLVSPGGVHSHQAHIHALLTLAASEQLSKLYIHAVLDGRDTPPKSAYDYLLALEKECKLLQCGQIVSIIGRYYAMDRDKHWDRIQLAYDLLVSGTANYQADNSQDAIKNAYQRNESDEFVAPTTIHPTQKHPITIEDGDSIIFMNFRADRAREITRAFIDPQFNEFPRQKIPRLQHFVGLTQYDVRLNAYMDIAYGPQSLRNILAEYLSQKGIKQLRMAETEKYAHVTFFFNGGIEQAFPGEERVLIQSPKVATYDLQPEMSAIELCEQLVAQIKSQRFQFIVANFANPDMVGHTGDFAATVKAIETIDYCLGHIIKALKEVGAKAIITADHGNAELMYDPLTEQPHTAHTKHLVPFVYIGRSGEICKQNGSLADIAPTILHIMGLPQPAEMTGQTLISDPDC
jgi:2,3-bisphosphoglycerate-independent phosphoglycerate mutase